MKQTYVKPVLVMENFTLNQSIAHNCSPSLDFSNATLKDKSSCGWDIGVGILWNHNGCSIQYDGNQIGNTDFGCYNNPEGGLNIFNS